MAEKVTVMVLKVDLQCASCYKKVKKVLCKFPQIRDQVYDEKANTVTITVVCCSPEKIRDKLCCKGNGAIKSIEIKEPPKPKPVEKPKEPEKPKDAEKPKDHVKSTPNPEKQKPPPEKPVEKPPKVDKPKGPPPTPAPAPPPAPAPAPAPVPVPVPVAPQPVPINFCEPVHGYPHMPMYPTGICCGPCSEGYGGGPCYHGYGRSIVPPPPGPCFDGYGNGYGYRANKSCCVSSDYFSEENPQGCTIM